MIPARPLVATAAGLAVAGLLAGCSNAPRPPSAPAAAPAATAVETPPHEHGVEAHAAAPATSSSTAPTPTATRELPRPELSDVGRTFTQDGASTFASYYVRVLNYSRNSGDVELLRSISDEGCTGCRYDADEVIGFANHGYSHVGLETQFRGTWYRSWTPETGEAEMDVSVARAPHTVVDRDGTVIEEVPGVDDATFFLWLKWIDGRWKVWEAE